MSSIQPGSANVNIHTSVSNQAQTIAGLNAVGAAMGRLRLQMLKAGEATHLQTVRTQGYNQAWFTVRRLAYASTLAIGAATVGVIKFGLEFNSSMQQNMVAFTHFLGSTQLATAYLDKLYDLAARTPFEFQDLTMATKKLIAFGYTADQAYRTMVDIGDAAAGLGISKEGIDRMTLAFGQMKTNGRILGGELRQLSEVGINARKYLQQAFNLTPDQMANIGRLHIPAEQGIEAILRGMEGEFNGFAEKQAGTFQGMLSTIHDYAQKLFGTITKPLFDRLSSHYLPKMITLSKDLASAFEEGGWTAMARVVSENVGGGAKLMLIWGRIVSISKSLSIIISKELWPAFKDVMWLLTPLIALLWPVSWALQVMASHTTTFRIALTILLGYLVLTRIYLMLGGKAMQFYYAQMWRILVLLKVGLIPQIQRWVAWSLASARAQNGQFLAGYRNNGMIARLSRTIIYAVKAQVAWLRITWANTAGQSFLTRVLIVGRAALLRYAMMMLVAARASAVFLLTNPIGWAILIITTLVILYYKWGWFHDKVNSIFFWIKNHWPLLVAIMLGPLTLIGYGIYKFWDKIWERIQWIWNKAKGLWEWIVGKFEWLPGVGPEGATAPTNFAAPPGLRATSAMGAPTINRQKANQFDSAKTGAAQSEKTTQVDTKLYVDRKVFAEAVTTHKLYKDATR